MSGIVAAYQEGLWSMRKALVCSVALTTLAMGVTSRLFAIQGEDISGVWRLDPESSAPPAGGFDGGPTGPDGGMPPPPGGGRGPGGFPGGMPGGMGGGMPGGFPGGGPGGGKPPSKEEMERQRGLMEELRTLPPLLTITKKDDVVEFVEPDGVVRRYGANGKTEKHQLNNGVVETKTKWTPSGVDIEFRAGRLKLVRSFLVKPGDPPLLEVITRVDGAPRDAAHRAVYAPQARE